MKFGRFFRPAAFFSFLGMLFPLLLNSCSQISGAINEPVREYFERGSTVTQIVSHEILSVTTGAPAATAKDKNGHICVGSASGIKVKLHVNNPMNYTFTEGSNLSYYLVDSTSATLTDADSISLNMTSSTEWELTYPASFLTAAEYGKNISVRIDLSHPETGTAFPSYTIPLYCNSVPPLIANALTYTKTVTATNTKTYVVCFTIAPLNPLTSNDLKSLKIGSTTIPISVSGTGITTTNLNLHQTSIANVLPTAAITYQPNGQPFPSGGSSGINFYYETSDPVTTDRAYTISLIDEAGLTSSATTAANSYTIAATTLIDSAGNSHDGVLAPATPIPADQIKLGQDEDSSYAKVKIKVPTSATGPVTKSISGVTVEYTVTNTADSTNVATGTTTSDYNLNLAPGTYTIVCTATKDGYTTSETTFSVKVIPTKVYVKSTGDDTDGDGTIDHPYATISHADSKLPITSETPTGAVRTIYVLDDLGTQSATINNADCINCQNNTLTDVHLNISRNCVLKNATIAGTDGSKKIAGSGTGSSGNKVLENVTLAKAGVTTEEIVTGPTKLINVKSTENNVINGNNITIAGKIKGLTFTLNDGKTLAIEESMAGSSGNKIVLTGTISGQPSPGHPRVFTTGYSTYNTANPASYFTSDYYGIIKATVSGTAEAALAVSGGSISVYTPDGKLTLTPSSYSIPTTGDDITISATGTLESGTTVDDSDTTKFTDWDIKAYYEYDYRHASPTAAPTPAAVPAATSPLTLNFPAGYPAGNYVIVIFVTFNGTRYSSEIVVTKS